MAIHYKKAQSIILILILSLLTTGIKSDAAQKKKPAIKPKLQKTAGIVSRKRVLKEFKDAFQVPPASKMIQSYHTGKIRNYKEARGAQQVPFQEHQVAVILQLTDCGIKMRYIWNVYYYKLETEWIFQDIRQIKSTQLTWPKKKHPVLNESETKKIVSEGIIKQYSGVQVQGVTILNNKATWRLCVPEYQVTSKVELFMKDDVYNRITRYECIFNSTLAHQNGSWGYIQSGCTYKNKGMPDCHIGTMCRELSTESTVPAITDSDAVKLLQAAFEDEYGLKKNNINVEIFNLTAKLPAENFGKKIPCTMQTRYTMDENKEISYNDNAVKMTAKVRAVYECIVYGFLRYSLNEKKWEGVIESCCPSENENCGLSCSNPGKGCKRLGEK
jgi:hypothetical protein